MKTLTLLLLLLAAPCATIAASGPAVAPSAPPFDASPLHYGGTVNKVAVDTLILMGPRGLYPYRGDFESALPRPLSSGTVTDGWVSRDFSEQLLGPDWVPGTEPVGVGDFARVWSRLGDLDRCLGNATNQVAFLDDGLVVPGTGGTVGLPGYYDYATPDGWVVNGTHGLLGPGHVLNNGVLSPVMILPGGHVDGVLVSFDTYVHKLLTSEYAGVAGNWYVRSAIGSGIESAPWRYRGSAGFPQWGPAYARLEYPVGDLLVPGATQFQILFAAQQWCPFQDCTGMPVTTPAPYFDNVRVAVYPSAGPRIVASESRLANDGFPAGGVLDLANPARNSVRFDMASPSGMWGPVGTVPGDSIAIDVTPRSGATLDPPVLHWTLARRNPVFDPFRTLPPGPVTGRVTRYPGGGVVENRWNFDLPDTGFLFPGDVLHYYFAATDHAGGDTRTTTLPADLSGFGNADPLAYPGYCTVRCLPTVADLEGAQPRVLFWNDQGFGDGEDEWHGALRRLGFREGVDYDVYATHAPASGLGNGLGGRASVAQIAGYTDLLYSSGKLGAPTISTGDDPYGDRGDDLGLLEAWLTLGGRDLFLSGDDLAYDLYTRGTRSRTFVTSRMGLICHDTEVNIDIDDQDGPLVAVTAGNPVFQPTSAWVVHGACPQRGDFDAVTVTGSGVRLAQFTAPDGVSTPYPYAAAVLNAVGDTRVVSLCYDLLRVTGGAKSPAPPGARDQALGDVLAYFGATGSSAPAATMPPSAAATLTVFPNPFNPSVKLRWELPQPTPLTLKIFDVRGALVRTLADRLPAEAVGELTWNGDDDGGGEVASGVYFVEARASGQVRVEKITLVR